MICCHYHQAVGCDDQNFQCGVFQALVVPNLKANILKSVFPHRHYMHADMSAVYVEEIRKTTSILMILSMLMVTEIIKGQIIVVEGLIHLHQSLE